VLPEDTETGWSLLTPEFQQEVGSFEDYDGFWSTVDSVTVDDTQPAGPDAVDVTLTYTTDGSSEQEVRRIEVVEGGDGYLISGDAVVG
jgi:eukaryotic-like serine/threonine-protein kinase